MKENDTFEIYFPVPRTHCGIYSGNGNLGAMVWGKEKLHITVNRSDFWDHRGGERLIEGTTYEKILKIAGDGKKEQLDKAFKRQTFPENVFKPQRLPVGRFEFSFDKGIKPHKLTLEYSSGEISLATENGKQLYINISMYDNIILIHDSDRIIREVAIRPSWDFPKSREWLERYGFVPPKILKEEDFSGWIMECPDDPALACICMQKGEYYVIIPEKHPDSNTALKNALETASQCCQEKILSENRTWWKDYWKNSAELYVPDEFFNSFFKYALYKFACATSPEGGVPAGLQGPWIEEYQQAQWSGDYHFNVNIQQIYTLGFPLGKFKHLLPLFDMLESEPFISNMRHNAKVLLGIDDGLLLTHAVDDRGMQCGGLSAGAVLDQACAGWTAMLYWLYWLYSGDREFLENRAYPFMKGVMRIYEEMLEERNGRLSLPLAISAEYGCRNPNGTSAGRDPSYQLACARMLCSALIKASEVLGVEPKPEWLEIMEKLPLFSVIEGKDFYTGNTEKRIAVWERQDLEICHRHHSHLACIYPFDSLPENPSPEIRKIIDNSIDHWILMGMGQWSEWCIPWAAIIQARLGFSESPAVLLSIWKEIFVNEGMHTVYLPKFRGIIAHRRHDMKKPKESNEIMQLDGTMSGATALIEMAIHFHSGTLHVFKGIPEKWRDVSFKNIFIPGPFITEGARENGKFKYLRIESTGGTSLRINIPGVTNVVVKKNGNIKSQTAALPVNLYFNKGDIMEIM